MIRSRGIRRKQLLYDLKETRGYCKLKKEALDRTVLGIGFVRGYGSVVMNERTCGFNLLIVLRNFYGTS